jgi:hypothetical protein
VLGYQTHAPEGHLATSGSIWLSHTIKTHGREALWLFFRRSLEGEFSEVGTSLALLDSAPSTVCVYASLLTTCI